MIVCFSCKPLCKFCKIIIRKWGLIVQKQRIWQSVAILALFFVIMYVANAWMPMYRDDYWHSVIWRTGEHLQSMGDVMYSLERYYITHGGRIVSFFFQFFFMWVGKYWYNWANAFVFCAMLAVMLMHVRRDVRFLSEPKALLLLGVFSWLGISHFGEIAIWCCGSAVYLWTGLFAAIFLLPYNIFLAGNMKGSSWLWMPFMFLMGMIGACSVENLTVTTSLLAVGTAYWAKRKGMLKGWMITGAVGSVIGTVACLFSPGNQERIVDDNDSGWLFHFLNQIPGNLEMVMYMVPIILVMVLAWRILCIESARKRGITVPAVEPVNNRHIILWALLALSLVSYVTTGFFSDIVELAVVKVLLTPVGLTDSVTLEHWNNVVESLEEVLLYVLAVAIVYLVSAERMGLYKKRVRALRAELSWRQVVEDFPQLRYVAFLIGLSFFNNFVVVGAPSFPGRALFSSSIIFIIGAVAMLRIQEVWQVIGESASAKILRRGGLCIAGFIMVATLVVLHSIWQEDAIRVGHIAYEANKGTQIVTLPPSAIPERRRVLRHIAYDDYDNGLTRLHVCTYFGITDVELDPNVKLEDIKH